MKIKAKVSKTLLFEGVLIIVIGEIVNLFLPEININSASPMEVYQQALNSIFWNGVVLLGWIMCLIWGIVFLVRSIWPRFECKICGAKIKNKDDLFCRECGAKLKTDGST